jgi:hypothetical protein
LQISPTPIVNNDEIKIPVWSDGLKYRGGNSYAEARRAAQIARRLFDSQNLIRPTGDLIFKKLMTESPKALLDLINRIVKPKTKFTRAEIKNPELVSARK